MGIYRKFGPPENKMNGNLRRFHHITMCLRSLRPPLHWVQAPLRRVALRVQFRGVGDTETLDDRINYIFKQSSRQRNGEGNVIVYANKRKLHRNDFIRV
jgi:hypothetical protein